MRNRAPGLLIAVVGAAIAFTPAPGQAVRAPDPASSPSGMETASGRSVRSQAQVTARAPQRMMKPWIAFLADAGASWRGTWDSATGVPRRLFGPGMEIAGSVSRRGVAARHARAFLERHIDLLAPGSSAGDFVLVSDVAHRGMRSVGFVQTFQGMRVLGGQVSFRYKNDRLFLIGSQALPDVSARFGLEPIDDADARTAARAWVAGGAAEARAGAVEGPFVLPLVGAGGVDRYTTVLRVTVEARRPIGKWHVYVDAYTGELVAREQKLMFAEGTVQYDAPVRYPIAERQVYPARDASVLVNGEATTTDGEGLVSWVGDAAATVVTRVVGPLVKVENQAGANATGSFDLAPGGTLTWESAADEQGDAQIATYVHSRIAKEYARSLDPQLDFLDGQLPANVNINESCNAFSDGNSINFFVSSSQCANTGRLADVVYHEFGHSLHAHAIIEGVGAFDGAHSEGLSDFLAASITDDPAMGRGFFKSNGPLRHIDPSDMEHRWPDDIGGIHYTGLIFAGAMWDLRTILIEKYGREEGVALADRLFYATLQRATDIPSTYFEVLAEDDDDGDLSNGTPNVCDINAAFGLHGLRTLTAEVSPLAAEVPSGDGYPVSVRLGGLFEQCPGDSVDRATLAWHVRGDEETGGEVEMTGSDGVFDGTLPEVPEGRAIRYQIEIEFSNGLSRTFPNNPADPAYEFFAGEVIPLYCTGFETDPFQEGWTHGLTSGDMGEGADDWMWGIPQGPPASGDPEAAFTGDYVIGNDLGGGDFNGKYQPDKTNFAMSPAVEVENYTNVRLQYWRWLNVEDAFFDQATIYVNDQLAWQNFNSDNGNNSTIHHADREWRFHDVPMSKFARDGEVQAKFEITSDGGLEFGGWTMDDFCIVAYAGAVCGDGEISEGSVETCDDGDANSDTEPDACRTSCVQAYCGDGVVDSGEACDDGNDVNDDTCTNTCEEPVTTSGGCGCRVGGDERLPATGTLLLLLAASLALVWLFRRRR